MKTIGSIVFYFIQCFLLILKGVNVNNSSAFAQEIQLNFKHPKYQHPDIFVITNRQIDSSQVKFSFTNEVNPDPSLAFFRVNAAASRSIQFNRLDSSAFINEISEIKNQDWLLFIHGDSKTIEEAVIRGLTIQNTHKIRVIVFAWPSKDTNLHGLKNLKTSYRNVEKSLPHFNTVLQMMAGWRNSQSNIFAENRLSLFLHSLGNKYLEELVNKQLLTEPARLLFDNVILNAAAVESENHPIWVSQLKFQNNLFINSNRRDINLWALRFFTNHGKQLGQKVKPPYANNAHYFNFTRTVGCRLNPSATHTYFIGKLVDRKNELRLIYHEMLHGLQPDLTDKSRFVKRRLSSLQVIVR